ncbi:4-diphosphocytidyl-2-C-methyl-D-erythritol kinase [Mariniphaga anaerophila]|uniref:4-diphosphocytidyl-2-C-methyl-D-erythritol kinase n=1 Tax=Mariniphaga anaerophila TaxID=1484053 RepID=A0A1M5DJG8_9BACT|nr:4-(cytidine 5'-diphospho)-2-C-methyl-D-erythritol kinase [Mariniphaga anaerophila]SHF67041.1 4-diphosphocytidyl-2-C-methyl-D-erythritol kinase [Mariniphaga anaerophila]
MIVFPNAKINIGLNVVSKRPDGYHNLETVFYPVSLSDALEMVEAPKSGISFSGTAVHGAPEDNLVLRAYNLVKKDFGLPPVHFHLHKVIPTGAGLGGGSSDAAFTLKLLNNFFELQISVEQLKNYAAAIGADCPFFIENRPAFATGIGDVLSPVQLDLSRYKLLIVKPPFGVSTPDAYRNIVLSVPSFSLSKIQERPVEEWKELVKNDFEKSVFKEYPEIENIKMKLYEMGAVYASMSGSGSSVFGIFRELPVQIPGQFPNDYFVFS